MNKTNVRQTFFQVSLVSRPNDLITWPSVASLSVTVLYLVLIFFSQVCVNKYSGFSTRTESWLWSVWWLYLMVCGHSFPCVYERTSFVYISLSRASVTFKDTRIINRMVRFRFKVAFSNTSVFEEPFIHAQFFPNSATSGCFVHESQYGERIIICFIRYTVSKLYNFCFLGYMISTLSPTVATASSISAPLLLPLLLLGGFYVKNT